MPNKSTLIPAAIFLMFVAGCASEDPMYEDPGDDLEEGIIGDPAEAEGDGAIPPNGLLPSGCDSVANWDPAWSDLEAQVLTLVNQKRAAGATCGGKAYPKAPALTANENLRCSARKHSKDMGDNNFMSHTGSNGSAFSDRITQAGYTWTAAAENVAVGQTTASSVMTSWMNSAGHCANIMNPVYVHLGVGYYKKTGTTYVHHWTQNFAKP